MSGDKLPTIDECRAAGTHMLRCTGDGACKVCYDSDALDEQSLYVFNPATRTLIAPKKRGQS